MNDSRKIAPTGWHIASDAEWTTLANYLGGSEVAGGKLKSTGTIEGSTGLWHTLNMDATNSFRFNGLPGGRRGFTALNFYAYFWTSSEGNIHTSIGRRLNYNSAVLEILNQQKNEGYSVRCIKD